MQQAQRSRQKGILGNVGTLTGREGHLLLHNPNIFKRLRDEFVISFRSGSKSFIKIPTLLISYQKRSINPFNKLTNFN